MTPELRTLQSLIHNKTDHEPDSCVWCGDGENLTELSPEVKACQGCLEILFGT